MAPEWPHEFRQPMSERLTDGEWQRMLAEGRAAIGQWFGEQVTELFAFTCKHGSCTIIPHLPYMETPRWSSLDSGQRDGVRSTHP